MISLETVEKVIGTNGDGKRILQVSLNADTSAEVKAIGNDSTTVEGMAPDTVIAPFSSAFTVAEQELLQLGSDNVWK